MKIYALVYTYKIKKPESDYATTMTKLVHCVGETLEDVMSPTEKEIREEEGYVDYSLNLSLRQIMPLSKILDDIKVHMPELVKNAKQREKIIKVAEALQDE